MHKDLSAARGSMDGVAAAPPEPAPASGIQQHSVDHPRTDQSPRVLLVETVLVLGVSLGASAIWAVLAIVRRITAQVALNQQTSSLNSAVTPDRPWLDLAYQLTGIGLGVVPVLLALHLLRRDDRCAAHVIGADLRSPGADLARGTLLALAVGVPGLGFYLLARSLGLNTQVQASGLGDTWWAVPVLFLAAVQNALLEEVVVIGYLLTRWAQAGMRYRTAVVISALIRGTYHLYQGFGGFLGNVVMGLFFGWVYRRSRRIGPLVVAHALIDIVAFVGYATLRARLNWL